MNAATTTTRPVTLYAKESAALIRRVLKQAFPACKFSVRTERGSMVSSVRVSWTDGPTPDRVDALVQVFRAGSFDGMDDSYTYLSGTDRLLVVEGVTYERGVQYVFTSRTVSPALANRCIAAVAIYWGGVTEVPVAVAAPGGGYKLPDSIGDRAVRADLGQNGGHGHYSWYACIHRAANDRTAFMRNMEG